MPAGMVRTPSPATLLANVSGSASMAATTPLTTLLLSTSSMLLSSMTPTPGALLSSSSSSSPLSSSSSSNPFSTLLESTSTSTSIFKTTTTISSTSSSLASTFSSSILAGNTPMMNSTRSPFSTRPTPYGRRYWTSSSTSSTTSMSPGRSIVFDNVTRALSNASALFPPNFPDSRSQPNYVRSLGLGPVILDILIALFLTTFITGLVMNTFLVIALMRRKRPSTPSDLVVSNMHFCLYYLFLDSLVLFNELFVTPKLSVDFNGFYVSNPFTNCAMPYLFAVFHMGFFGCITVLSAILFTNVVHAPLSRIASMRNVAMALIFIWTFCILANVHFLLAHCDRVDYEYFIEYVQNVWIKFIIVDGSAIIMSVVFLMRTMTHLMHSDSPDRLLTRFEALGYMLVLLAYTMPLVVDALCALAENRMTLTSHRILTVAVREISYCTIPAVLARFRPLSRSDCHNLLDSIRTCFSRNFSRLSAASSRGVGGVRWSAASAGSRYFLAASNPHATSGGTNGGTSIGIGRSSSRRLDDDQVQILSICQDSQGAGFEDGL